MNIDRIERKIDRALEHERATSNLRPANLSMRALIGEAMGIV